MGGDDRRAGVAARVGSVLVPAGDRRRRGEAPSGRRAGFRRAVRPGRCLAKSTTTRVGGTAARTGPRAALRVPISGPVRAPPGCGGRRARVASCADVAEQLARRRPVTIATAIRENMTILPLFSSRLPGRAVRHSCAQRSRHSRQRAGRSGRRSRVRRRSGSGRLRDPRCPEGTPPGLEWRPLMVCTASARFWSSRLPHA